MKSSGKTEKMRQKITKKIVCFFYFVFNAFLYHIYSVSICLDFSSVCNIACPRCPTKLALKNASSFRQGFLSQQNFSKFITKYRSFIHIFMQNSGELFLNPNLLKILYLAKQKKVDLYCNSGTTLNHISNEVMRALPQSTLKNLNISIDGVTNAVYKKYRLRGNLALVLKNIKTINQYKEKFRSIYPKLTWRFIVFAFNEHQIKAARTMSAKLEMDFSIEKNYDQSFYPPSQSLPEYKKKDFVEYLSFCQQLWLQPAVGHDGELYGCCINKSISFGNIFTSDLKTIVKGKMYKNTKNFLLGNKYEIQVNIPCISCPIYSYNKKKVSE